MAFHIHHAMRTDLLAGGLGALLATPSFNSSKDRKFSQRRLPSVTDGKTTVGVLGSRIDIRRHVNLNLVVRSNNLPGVPSRNSTKICSRPSSE